jgi:hypothetical protein
MEEIIRLGSLLQPNQLSKDNRGSRGSKGNKANRFSIKPMLLSLKFLPFSCQL